MFPKDVTLAMAAWPPQLTDLTQLGKIHKLRTYAALVLLRVGASLHLMHERRRRRGGPAEGVADRTRQSLPKQGPGEPVHIFSTS